MALQLVFQVLTMYRAPYNHPLHLSLPHHCSVPHKYNGELAEFVLFASDQLHKLCEDLKLHGLRYRVGKDYKCAHCFEEDFFEVASHEQGGNQLKKECSCSCPISINDLLCQDLEQTNDKLSELGNADTHAPTHAQIHTHTHIHTLQTLLLHACAIPLCIYDCCRSQAN